ncbi:MAG TPA: ROK family protein [Verrucomicrobiae bacterium]|nr:ROK family protein [Verrucomicrobiae bacterium]
MATRKKQLPTVLAIDIGGTKVAAGFVDSRGRILAETRAPMTARRSAQEGLRSVFQAVDSLRKQFPGAKPRCIGVGVAGWVDPARGVLIGATNIPCWKNFPLAEALRKRYGITALLSNDANAAALAEAVWGVGKGHSSFFHVTLGTGVGTGIILNGKVLTGWSGAAGEGGHVTINFQGPLCDCGKRGCIEAYSSGTGIARRARERLKEEPRRSSRMRELAGGKTEQVTSKIVSEAARKGDSLAQEILEEAADHLGIWMGTVVDMIEPEMFVIGGGMGHLMMKYRGRMRRQLKKWAITPQRMRIPIVEARFGAGSELAGAAALCFASLEARRR